MISRRRALLDALLCGAASMAQSPWFYAAAGALIATSLFAAEPSPSAPPAPEAAARAIAEEADALRDIVRGVGLDALLPGAQTPGPDVEDAARRLLALSRERAADAAAASFPGLATTAPVPPPPRDPAPLRYLVFVSAALGEGALRAVDALAAARGDMEVVYRGLAEGETIEAFATRRLSGRNASPATIDPRPFREHGVVGVPAVLDRQTGLLVRGVADPDALEGRAHGEVLGPVVLVSEADLAEVMKARAQAIDWRARMTAAVDTWFERADFEALAPAREDRVRRIDARVRLAQDFVLPDGRVIARAGQMFDPSALRPLSLSLVVFDPRDPLELDAVEALLPGLARPVLIASQIDPVEGWATFERLARRLKHPVYLLMPDIRARFAIERTVSVVTGGPGWFEVREIAPTVMGEAAP